MFVITDHNNCRFYAIPFAVLILAYDELRKYLLRQERNRWTPFGEVLWGMVVCRGDGSTWLAKNGTDGPHSERCDVNLLTHLYLKAGGERGFVVQIDGVLTGP